MSAERHDPWSALLADAKTRRELWRQVSEIVETHAEKVDELRVAPRLNPAAIRGLLAECDFTEPMAPGEAVEFAAKALAEHQVHTPHPSYFGLFNPAPTTMGIAADTLVAAFNPQIAAWSHSPFAAEVERHLVRAFGVRFGYEESGTDGA